MQSTVKIEYSKNELLPLVIRINEEKFYASPKELSLLDLLLCKDFVTIDDALSWMYSHPDYEPMPGIIAVYVHKLRAKLKALNSYIDISVMWGAGFRIKNKPRIILKKY